MHPRRFHGFTLIELLVVVTIIVVLLALLMPAMDKAIYQASLAHCQAKLGTVARQVVMYAMEHRRYYPDRGIQNEDTGVGTGFSIMPIHLTQPLRNYDMRPPLAGYIQINKMLNCSLVTPVDLEDVLIDEGAMSSYTMWWAWQYRPQEGDPEAGMFRIGDRFTWTRGSVTQRYSTLIGDYDRWRPQGELPIQSSHPDHDRVRFEVVAKRESAADLGFASVTGSLWTTERDNAGLSDFNHAFDDGSADRYADVKPNRGRNVNRHDSERMGWVPMQFNEGQPGAGYQIPKR